MLIILIILSSISIILSSVIIVFLLQKKTPPTPALDPKLVTDLQNSLVVMRNLYEEQLTKRLEAIREGHVLLEGQLKEVIKLQLVEALNAFRNESDKLHQNTLARYREQDTFLKESIASITNLTKAEFNTINERINEQLKVGFTDANQTFKEVMTSLVRIEDAKTKMDELASQVLTLSKILENSQARGQYGEFQLENILESVFPGGENHLYATQYQIGNVRADAVVFMREPQCVICIDAKFPLITYQAVLEASDEVTKEAALKTLKAELKRLIKDVSSKYVVKGITFSHAFIFLPSDGILALIHEHLAVIIDEAQKSMIMFCAPSTLLPTLAAIHTVNTTIERIHQIKEISGLLNRLSTHFRHFTEDWQKHSRNLQAASQLALKLDRRFENILDQFKKIEQSEIQEISPSDLVTIDSE